MKKVMLTMLGLVVALGLIACGSKESESSNEASSNEVIVSAIPSSEAPASIAPSSEAPASIAPSSEAPASIAPSSETPASIAPSSETPTSVTPSSEASASVTPSSETPASVTPSSAAPAGSAVDSSIVGKWTYEAGGFTYTFNADGTGTYLLGDSTLTFTYTTSGGVISILYDNYGSGAFVQNYVISGSQLNMIDSFGNDVYYNRVN